MLDSVAVLGDLMAEALLDRDGLVASVERVFIDESGTHDGSPSTSVAILFARPIAWMAWEQRWNRIKGPLAVFHAKDAANLRGTFKGWDRELRDALVVELMAAINESPIYGVVAAINRDEFSQAISGDPNAERLAGSEYQICLQLGLERLASGLRSVENMDRLAIFHETNDFQGAAIKIFDRFRRGEEALGRKVSYAFAGKNDATPLQAADVMAYEANKRARNFDAAERRAWRAMNTERNKVEFISFGEREVKAISRRISEGTMDL